MIRMDIANFHISHSRLIVISLAIFFLVFRIRSKQLKRNKYLQSNGYFAYLGHLLVIGGMELALDVVCLRGKCSIA